MLWDTKELSCKMQNKKNIGKQVCTCNFINKQYNGDQSTGKGKNVACTSTHEQNACNKTVKYNLDNKMLDSTYKTT